MDGEEIVYIDGSEGEGGGQVLRSALTLSMCLAKPFRIENIRARRKKPSLLRQHLTAVKAAARISQARVHGDDLGSQTLVFKPGEVQAGEYHFSIGSAGSATLVLQTILLPLLLAKGGSKIIVEGGTHNPLAPPFEFLQQTYLPLLAQMGADIKATLVRPGFFPKGGGRIEVELQPSSLLKPISLLERGNMIAKNGVIYLAGLPQHIAEREINVLGRKLDMSVDDFEVKSYGTDVGPGNVILLTVQTECVSEVFTGYGQKGLRAEIVAQRVVDDVRDYFKSGVPVDWHLADQLLLPMALAGGGEFVTCTLTQHTETNMRTVRKFLNYRFTVMELEEKRFNVKLISE